MYALFQSLRIKDKDEQNATRKISIMQRGVNIPKHLSCALILVLNALLALTLGFLVVKFLKRSGGGGDSKAYTTSLRDNIFS